MAGKAESISAPAADLANTEVRTEKELQRGESLLARISTEVVQTFKEYYGKGPTSAKSYMVDDLLFVVMRGGLNSAEKFLLEKDEVDVVRQYRQTFENRMNEILSGKIEKLTGRQVIAFQSQILFDPDMSIEMFVFDDRGRRSRSTRRPSARSPTRRWARCWEKSRTGSDPPTGRKPARLAPRVQRYLVSPARELRQRNAAVAHRPLASLFGLPHRGGTHDI
jgi:uncharacterized protein YbcI